MIRMRESYTNPSELIQIEYFRNFVFPNGSTNESFENSMDLQIQSLGFVRILACLKYVYVLRICMDSWGIVGFVKTGRIFEKCVSNRIHKSESLRIGLANPDLQIYEVGFVNHNTNRTFLESGFMTTIQNKFMFLQISYTIPATLRNSRK